MTPPRSIWAVTSGVRFHAPATRASALMGTWWATKDWKNSTRNVDAPALSLGSLGEAGAGELSVTGLTSTTPRTVEGSGSSATTITKKTSDIRLEEGGYEMHALGATGWMSGESAGHGDDESVSAVP